MRRVTGIIVALAVAGLAACSTGPGPAAQERPPAVTGILVPPAAPSVVASGCSTWVTAPGPAGPVVHVRTTLQVRHARAPQAGVPGQVTVSSIDVAFVSGGTPVGWASGAIPPGSAALVTGNGTAELTVIAYRIYLSGRWAPDCKVERVYWLPGDHS
jgi:hypothetical protein